MKKLSISVAEKNEFINLDKKINGGFNTTKTRAKLYDNLSGIMLMATEKNVI